MTSTLPEATTDTSKSVYTDFLAAARQKAQDGFTSAADDEDFHRLRSEYKRAAKARGQVLKPWRDSLIGYDLMSLATSLGIEGPTCDESNVQIIAESIGENMTTQFNKYRKDAAKSRRYSIPEGTDKTVESIVSALGSGTHWTDVSKQRLTDALSGYERSNLTGYPVGFAGNITKALCEAISTGKEVTNSTSCSLPMKSKL